MCPGDIKKHADPMQVTTWVDWDPPQVVDDVDGNSLT